MEHISFGSAGKRKRLAEGGEAKKKKTAAVSKGKAVKRPTTAEEKRLLETGKETVTTRIRRKKSPQGLNPKLKAEADRAIGGKKLTLLKKAGASPLQIKTLLQGKAATKTPKKGKQIK